MLEKFLAGIRDLGLRKSTANKDIILFEDVKPNPAFMFCDTVL
jgi:hypothetical protein